MNSEYDFNEHKHRYAVWTAARAVQSSITTTTNVSKAINNSQLREFSESNEEYTQDQFDIDQCIWCNQIMHYFEARKVPWTYGRAAKIVAIYLKSSVVLPARGDGQKASLIHPPIGRKFLRFISGDPDMKHLAKKKWKQFTDGDYWGLVGMIRSKFEAFNWTLEKYWKP